MRGWWVLAAGLTLWGCGGDESSGGGGATPDGGGSPGCSEDARRCGEASVEVCLGGEWRPLSPCPAATACDDGVCVPDGCTPDCDRRVCGDDGCGGSCGACDDGQTCTDGRCLAEGPACRDGVCSAGEDCASCEADCACDDGEMCGADGRCAAVCVPECAGRACGDDGCGGDCGACDGGRVCDVSGACVAPPAECGDDACGADEDCATCPADCGACCGDGACAGGENCATCPADCACPAGEACDAAARRCEAECAPRCDGRVCGDDGCGGSCGACDEVCTDDGRCVADCAPACDGRVCGGDGCGGSCGVCPQGDRCTDGDCVPVCVPACGDRVCGDDGCGGTCGGCGGGEECRDGRCQAPCAPSCDGRVCGDDGCGGSCGACDEGFACHEGACFDQRGCDCAPGERCLEGICRAPDQLCSGDNPNGLCPSGFDCLAGTCADAGAACGPVNPAGVCPARSICLNRACAPVDDAALCDDGNACTTDAFDPARNRCVHPTSDGPCDDGNACTADRCEAGACVSTPVAGCVEPPVLDPYVTPTNVGELNLAGTKPAGAAVEINGNVAVAESPEERWSVRINLQPGENVFAVRSVDRARTSATVTVRIVYDITAPVTRVSPGGGVFLNGVTVTVASDEPAEVFYTTDGGTPDEWSPRFFATRTFRIFDTTTLRFRARDPAGNWELAPVEAAFEITGHGNGWRPRATLPEALSLAAVTSDGASVLVVGGTDGDAPQAGAFRYVAADDAWVELASLAVPRTQAAAVTHGAQVYVLGGENQGVPLNNVERVGIAAPGEWEARRPMPTTRFGLAAVVVGGRIHAFGGKTNGGAVLDTHEVYDVGANTWSNQVEQMPRARFAFAAVHRDGLVFLVGGEDEMGRPIAEVDVYDPAQNRWTQAPDLPTPRSFVAAGRMDNLGAVRGSHTGVVVAGGRLADGRATPVVEEYVLDLGEWRARTPLPAGVHGAGAAVLDLAGDDVDTQRREVWLVGGQTGEGLTDALTAYGHGLDYVRRLEGLPEGRFMHAAATVGDAIYLFGGRNFQETLEGWRFDPETETYAPLPRLPSPQNALASASLGGVLYAIGGRNNFGVAVPTVRAYDPADGRWVDRRPLQVARSEAAAVVVGREIYVIGGENNGPLQAVEIYDPATDRWRNGPVLPDARRGAMAAAVDGDVYVFGGLGDEGAERSTVLRLRAGAWSVVGGSVTASFGAATAVHDDRIAIFAGRRGGVPTAATWRYDVRNNRVERAWTPDTEVLARLDHSAGAWLHGRLYLFGGNENGMPGPSGVTTVQKIEGACFNGVLDPGEGQGIGRADAGGMCGLVSGCLVIPDLAASALARCRADGFQCIDRGGGYVTGWGNGGGEGSDCSPPNQWRMYCYRAVNDGCKRCAIGEIRGGHQPCSCNNPQALAGHWCEP